MNFSKLSNALFEDAEASEVANLIAGGTVDKFKKKYNGLWVGGKVIVNQQELRFDVNAVNQAMHRGLPKIVIPIEGIRSCNYEFGWFSGIVVVTHINGIFRFRCYGAKKVVNEISQYIQEL